MDKSNINLLSDKEYHFVNWTKGPSVRSGHLDLEVQ